MHVKFSKFSLNYIYCAFQSQLYGDPQKMYIGTSGGRGGMDSGRGSMISAAESIMSRLQGQPVGGTLERRQYGYGVTQGRLPVGTPRGILRYDYGVHGNKTYGTDPRSPVCRQPRLSSSQDILRNVEPSPYSCVDIVNLPTSRQNRAMSTADGCHSVASTYSDPAYGTNNLSATPLRKKCVTLPSNSAENFLHHNHFNIKRHPVDIKTLQDYSETNDLLMDQYGLTVTGESVGVDEVPSAPISSYVKIEDTDATEDETSSVDENTLEGDRNNSRHPPRVLSNYVCQVQFEKNRKCKPSVTSSPKQLNIKPSSRPISEVVNVPAHFYGSLSVLDTGDATEL